MSDPDAIGSNGRDVHDPADLVLRCRIEDSLATLDVDGSHRLDGRAPRDDEREVHEHVRALEVPLEAGVPHIADSPVDSRARNDGRYEVETDDLLDLSREHEALEHQGAELTGASRHDNLHARLSMPRVPQISATLTSVKLFLLRREPT